LKPLGGLFDITRLEELVTELDEKMLATDFWDDNEKAQIVLKDSNHYKQKIEGYEQLHFDLEEAEVMLEMSEEAPEYLKECDQLLEDIEARLEKVKLETLLSGDYDHLPGILSIHAGSGGLDAQDWAEMLFRMYTKWCDGSGYSFKIMDLIRDTEAGIKTVTMLIEGPYAYGYLKSEKGVHRLVRISPFDSSGKRHTSFASVDVMPALDDSIEVEINPVDLKIDTFRASGAGGQHVNTTDSAVRITHLPTGVVVSCQSERSQLNNKATAMKMLMAKLIELKEQEQKEKIEDLSGDYSQISWGSQIRSYVFHPYNMVKDHRTQAEVGNVSSVMDGKIEVFMYAYLKQKAQME
jgi:peptide chain release factor 2